VRMSNTDTVVNVTVTMTVIMSSICVQDVVHFSIIERDVRSAAIFSSCPSLSAGPHSPNNDDQSMVFHLSINLSFSFQTNDVLHAASAAGAPPGVQRGQYFTCDQCLTLRCPLTDNVCSGGVWSPEILIRCKIITATTSVLYVSLCMSYLFY